MLFKVAPTGSLGPVALLTMAEFLDKLYASLERVLNFPLFNLSDGPFRVSQLLTLLVFMVVVVTAERAFQRLILKRVLIRSRLQTSLQYAISRIIGYTIITFGCLIALQSVGLNLSSLTTRAVLRAGLALD